MNAYDQVRARLARNLDRLGAQLTDQARDRVGDIAADPAPPGRPPHQKTGEGRESIDHRVEASTDVLTLTVGTVAEHMLYQELGTAHMEPRPWLGPTFLAARRHVLQELTK